MNQVMVNGTSRIWLNVSLRPADRAWSDNLVATGHGDSLDSELPSNMYPIFWNFTS